MQRVHEVIESLSGEPLSFFSMCSDGPLCTPHLFYKAHIKLPQGRGLNVTLGHQSTHPPARVSWGKQAERQDDGEQKAKGRETLALAPLSITIDMCC